MLLQPGTILENRYRVDSLLGQGGMGAVYRAWHERLEQWVAIKENSLGTPEARAQFEREAKVLARLHHTNLPNVIDHFVTADGAQYLVMTFVEGVNLAELLAARGKQSPADVMMWLGQVCDALTYLHSQNPPIIHRDIKPQNIKITPNGHVFLVDFGLSKVGSTFQSTLSGALGATPGYAPLEQYGSAHTDQRSDVYALTATLYAMLTGETPPESVKRAVGTAVLTPPRAMNLTVSPALERALLHGLETQPTNRPASVATLRREVEAALASAKPEPRRQPAPPSRDVPHPSPVPKPTLSSARRGRGLPGWTLVGMGALVVVLLVLGVAAVGRGGQPTATVVAGNPTPAPTTEGTAKPKVTVAITVTLLPPKDTDTPTPIVPPTLTDTSAPSDTPTALPTNTPEAKPAAVVTSPSANVRTGPSTAYPLVGRVNQGTRLDISGKNTDGTWWQVCCISAKQGWIINGLVLVEGNLGNVPVVTGIPPPPAAPTRAPQPTATLIPEPITGTTRVRDVDGAVMVFVPAGEFLMGSAASDTEARDDERPQHLVTLAGYWIDRTEVTNAQYRKFVDAGGYGKKEYWTQAGWTWKVQNNVTQPCGWVDSNYNQVNLPVVCVSWYEAVAYARWAGARLPSEAEWEKAARGTDGRIYPWGNARPDCDRLNFRSCVGRPAPVGSYRNGMSPYGALDLAGNVWEWVSTIYGNYPYSSSDGREDLNGTDVRVLRGGGWHPYEAFVRSANRSWHDLDYRYGYAGFRLAASGL